MLDVAALQAETNKRVERGHKAAFVAFVAIMAEGLGRVRSGSEPAAAVNFMNNRMWDMHVEASEKTRNLQALIGFLKKIEAMSAHERILAIMIAADPIEFHDAVLAFFYSMNATTVRNARAWCTSEQQTPLDDAAITALRGRKAADKHQRMRSVEDTARLPGTNVIRLPAQARTRNDWSKAITPSESTFDQNHRQAAYAEGHGQCGGASETADADNRTSQSKFVDQDQRMANDEAFREMHTKVDSLWRTTTVVQRRMVREFLVELRNSNTPADMIVDAIESVVFQNAPSLHGAAGE